MSEARSEEPDLLALLERAKGGDVEARELLFAACYPRVLETVRKRLGTGLRRFHESGDVLQEALLHAARDLERVEAQSEDDLFGWLARVVENRLRDLARFHGAVKREAGRERREASIADQEEGDFLAAREESAETPSVLAVQGEDRERLHRALRTLEPGRQRVIELRNRDLAWAEVARELELPSAGAARMLHARALVDLARALEGAGPEGS